MSYPPQSNPPQPYPPQGQVPAPMQQAPAPLKKGRNTVGIVALVMAVIGFIFACVPGALIVGWILLPISFIILGRPLPEGGGAVAGSHRSDRLGGRNHRWCHGVPDGPVECRR